MARRFFFVSMGILALAVAYHLGADKARADWDRSAPGQIRGLSRSLAFTSTGEIWNLNTDVWTKVSWTLPIPASDVKLLSIAGSMGVYLITLNGEAWRMTDSGNWYFIGPFPGSPTAAQQTSWGSVKGSFAR